MSEFWNGRSVLVAGGAGLIGSYLTEELVRDGARVTVADNLESGTLENLSAVCGGITFLPGDLRETAFCSAAVRGQQVVMNLAARTSGIGYSQGHQAELFASNSAISLNLIEEARKAGAERYLLVSSSCVYPDDVAVPTPESTALSGAPELANEGYGWAKRLAELHARLSAGSQGMQFAIVRPFNAYGPRCRWNDETSHVIPALVKKVMRGDDPIVVWGDGNQRRNFLHARDVAWGMKLLTERYACGVPVNLGLDDTVSMKELASIILRAAGRGGCRLEFDVGKPAGRPVKSADSTVLLQVVPEFHARVSLENGIAEVVSWYRRCFGALHVARAGA